ncbi:TPA: phage portal protein [Escherichia coli]|nr:phage portal protein [Escherichia coli]
MTSLREYAGYHGGGSGFGGQLRAWNPPGESVDAALLPNFTRGNARADDLVRNNGYAANAIQLHQDHIVGSFFRLSHRPSWRYLGIGEEEARAFSREVEAAWKEFAEDDCCCIDVERKRTFTMMIREGVAMHAFNGELFVQATWDTSSSRLFRTQFRMVSPKRISNPNNTGDSRNCRAGVQINDSGAALGYYVSEDGQQGDPASVSFRIAAPAAPSRIELTPGYFQITATPHLAVYDPTVQFEFWFSEKRITDIRQVETTARYLGTALYWIAASINIKPGHDYYFYIRSVNTVGKSAFVEAVGRASDDAEGYLDFFKGKITESHLGKELLEKVDLTEDNASRLDEFSKEWKDANDKWNAMWGVKIEQTKDGKHYVAGIGLSMEDTEEGKLSQFLVAANRIAFIDPANGNETPMFVAQGNQIFMNDVFLKRLTAPTITSGGSPPVFSLTSDGKLTAKNADISGSVNANSGTLNNVTINQNCTIKGMLEATQVRGDFVKAVSKSFPKQAGTWGNTETPNGTVTVTISDDHNFDRQIIIPPIIFNGIAYSDPGSGNNPGGTRYTGYGFEVRKNGVLIASRETKGAIPGSYSAVIDMPSGRESVTLEFKVFHKGNQRAGNITDCTVIVTKKAASGISIR